MNTIYFLYGAPRSGKSTYAKKLVSENNGRVIRVNKDDLRDLMYSTNHSYEIEKFTLNIRDKIIEKALRDGHDVVVDDTNFPFGGKHFLRICEIAQLVGDIQIIEKFFDVELKELLKRNKESLDGKPVPEEVIDNMYNKYVKGKSDKYQFKEVYFPKIEKIKYNPKLKNCCIFDIDGSLAHAINRNIFDWKRVGEDSVDWNLKYINNIFHSYGDLEWTTLLEIIILSGRDSVCRPETEKWLQDNGIYYDYLYMRKENYNRKDSIIKKEIYDEYIKDKYNVLGIFDDRNQIIDMWRSLGLPAYQVNYGDF